MLGLGFGGLIVNFARIIFLATIASYDVSA